MLRSRVNVLSRNALHWNTNSHFLRTHAVSMARISSCPSLFQQSTNIDQQQQQQQQQLQQRVTKFKVIESPPKLAKLPLLYKELVKFKLAALVTLTTMAGYAIAPGESSVMTLIATTVGTGLCIGSANSINQWIENTRC